MPNTNKLREPYETLFRIKRGLAGYVSYLAACEMNESFSEYVLYEPTLRILHAQKYKAECEYPCKKIGLKDKRRIDFSVWGNGLRFAIEVKWVKRNPLNIGNDLDKLEMYHRFHVNSLCFLCVFGVKSVLNKTTVPNTLREVGKMVEASFRRTQFGCRIFELKLTKRK